MDIIGDAPLRVYVSPSQRKATADKFWSKVDKTGDCWLWTGRLRGGTGYGLFKIRGRSVGAHRFAKIGDERELIPAPKWLYVLHHCDNPQCVRPSHLWIGTQADNLSDCRAKRRARPWGRTPGRVGGDK